MAATRPAPSPPSPSPRRRLWTILAVWAVAVGGALALAAALDQPVGAGDRDAARPAAPEGVAGDEATATAGGLAEDLPPLTMILDRPLPDRVADLAPIRQAAELEQLARRSGIARRYVELGTVLQTLGDGVGATAAYRSALRAGGDDLAADTGLAMLQATQGTEGPARAASRLADLVAANPRSPLVSFNQGWLAAYRRDPALARAGWERTIAIDPGSRLAGVSRALIASLEPAPSGRNP